MKRKSHIEKKMGLLLNIGAGESRPEGFVNLDKRKLPGIDIVHDLANATIDLAKNLRSSIAGKMREFLMPVGSGINLLAFLAG